MADLLRVLRRVISSVGSSFDGEFEHTFVGVFSLFFVGREFCFLLWLLFGSDVLRIVVRLYSNVVICL